MTERILLKNVRLSYPHLFAPERFEETQDAKYGCVLLLCKDDPQVKALKEAVFKVGADKFGSRVQPGKWPSNLHWPIKDGDEKADVYPEQAGCFVISCTSKTKPTLLDRSKRVLTETDDKLYPGAFVNASLAVAPFDVTTKKGVSLFVNGVQFFADGERFAGHNAADDFEQLDDDDFDSYDV